MKNIYLCGHTGSTNRGCEAIVVSISTILEELGVKKENRFLFTYDKSSDERLNLDDKINLLSYPDRDLCNKIWSYINIKIGSNSIKSNKKYVKKFFDFFKNDSIVFSIGGDTYCYSEPLLTYALNEVLYENRISNVFFGCSIEGATEKNNKMCDDINNYTYIITRESESEKIFKRILLDKSKLFLACDPAFHLPIEKTKLPEGFKEKNTVGINLSPLVFGDFENDEDIMYKNIYSLMDYILKETDMNICLIPHVYNIEKNMQDINILNRIYKKYNNKRISIIKKELSCTQLKYIISKCRFFIGARTHATIAAYSTGVPTIVLSYSIKSRGIVKDLFKNEDGFLINWKEINKIDQIKELFINSLLEKENSIIENYKMVLPDYKRSIVNTTRKILELMDFDIK